MRKVILKGTHKGFLEIKPTWTFIHLKITMYLLFILLGTGLYIQTIETQKITFRTEAKLDKCFALNPPNVNV